MADPKNDEAALFAKFLSSRKVLIADGNAAARSSLFNVMKELGAKANQLFLANTFQQAEQEIISQKPHVVIAEYNLGDRCGLELLQNQRTQRPKETKECIFVVVTGDTSQTAAARALEEDCDAYIIKPYTIEFVRKTIMKAALVKIRPPAYLVAIEAGKDLLEKGEIDPAEAKFIEATTLESSPALAYYYLGQIKYLREILAQAQSNYTKGLKFNHIHYKCLVGLFELMMKQQRFNDAYDVVKKIAKYFPANPKRLSEVLRLAIITGEFDDIEKYYMMYMAMTQRNPTLAKHTSAALVVCARYHLKAKSDSKGKALDILRKSASVSNNDPKILLEIISLCLENDMIEDAQSFAEKFPPAAQKGKDCSIAKFLILNRNGTASLVIENGRLLLASGFKDARLYEIMITRSLEAGLSAAVENLLMEAKQTFPDRAASFELASKSTSGPSAQTPAPQKEARKK